MTMLVPIPKEKLMWYILQGYSITVDENSGTRRWYLNGRYHREDGPAIEHADGVSRVWCLNGERHREDGPAVEQIDGSRRWYLNGELHREDGPAVDGADGTRRWYLNGKYLREETAIREYKRGNMYKIMDKMYWLIYSGWGRIVLALLLLVAIIFFY